MKKLLAIILVTVMILSSLSMVSFANGEANTSAYAEPTITKRLVMNFETLGTDNRPNDIDCNNVPSNSYYADLTKGEGAYVTTKAGIFAVDTDGHRYIALNPISSYKPIDFIMSRGSAGGTNEKNTITGFDAINIKMKIVKRTDVDYTTKTPANYALSFTLLDQLQYGQKGSIASTKVTVTPTAFNSIETFTITKQQLEGHDLDLNSKLSKYTDEDSVYHQVMLKFQPKGGVATMIDEIEFVWYEKSMAYNSVKFMNNSIDTTSTGLAAGTTVVNADISDPNSEGGVFCAALYNKTTGHMEDVCTYIFTADTASAVTADVTIPQGASPTNYLIRTFVWNGLSTAKPILTPIDFDSTGVLE